MKNLKNHAVRIAIGITFMYILAIVGMAIGQLFFMFESKLVMSLLAFVCIVMVVVCWFIGDVIVSERKRV